MSLWTTTAVNNSYTQLLPGAAAESRSQGLKLGSCSTACCQYTSTALYPQYIMLSYVRPFNSRKK
jgi:hypothetical protein